MIYWDNNATTPCAPEVISAMQKYWAEEFGNPSSPHIAGRNAAKAVATARSQIASLVNCSPNEIVFTSGATESNNLIFLGILLSKEKISRKIVTTAIEHKSILEPSKFLLERGFQVAYLPVNSDGIIDLKEAKKIITKGTLLVSVQAANNEIGILQPIKDIARLAHKAGAFFHSDAAQAVGKIPFDVELNGCDFASFSAHKLYGPKGIGAIYIKGGPHSWPWPYPLRGGGQEGGLRPGTVNTSAIVGFGAAARLALELLPNEVPRLTTLEMYAIEKFKTSFPQCIIHAQNVPRLPGTLSLAIAGVEADLLIANLEDFCLGRGAACSSGAIDKSHVLKEINLSDETIESTLRISFGRKTDSSEVDLFIMRVNTFIERVKANERSHS